MVSVQLIASVIPRASIVESRPEPALPYMNEESAHSTADSRSTLCQFRNGEDNIRLTTHKNPGMTSEAT